MIAMTNEQMLINAAKAMGFEIIDTVISESNPEMNMLFVRNNQKQCRWWNPLKSIENCGDMECEKKINIWWFEDFISCDIRIGGSVVAEFNADYKDHPTKQHARMYASTMVATMIGAS